MSFLKNGDTLLFQGDSITDVGRRDTADGLGEGYVAVLRAWFEARHAGAAWKVLNRGVGGDRTVELLARWKDDCLALNADVLSVSIGVNDVWRMLGEWNGQTFVTQEAFEQNYHSLLDQARASGTSRFVLMSPTSIDEEADRDVARLLDERAAQVRRLAREYGAVYVPAREAFVDALRRSPQVRWTTDGCHPTVAGHALLAATWYDAVIRA